MGKVITNFTMSLGGFITDQNDEVRPFRRRYRNVEHNDRSPRSARCNQHQHLLDVRLNNSSLTTP